MKGLLRKVAKDDRLHPNKRMLSILLLGILDGHDYLRDILKEQYGTSTRVKWTDDPDSPNEKDKLNANTESALKSVFALLEEEDASGESK